LLYNPYDNLNKVGRKLLLKVFKVAIQVTFTNLGVGVVDSLTPRSLDAVGCPGFRVEEPALPLHFLLDCLLQSPDNLILPFTLENINPYHDHLVGVNCIMRHQILKIWHGVIETVPQIFQ